MPRSVSSNATTILIVEDEAMVRMELAGRIAAMGLIVLTAGDADEAIALLDSHPDISLLFTDILMRGSMDGIRLAHHVRLRWPPVKIIVASGLTKTALSALPADSIFLSKPFTTEAVSDALARMMMGSGPRAAGPQPRLSA